MARADLTAMLGRLEDTEERSLPSKQAASSKPAVQSGPPAGPKHGAKKQPDVVPPEPVQSAHFSQLERKEARLRADQYADLTTHARRLNRAKGVGGERITENTLIRVAIDLLLNNVEELQGSTEAELTESVTNRRR